ncbi:MAG: tripartite tricarboxylate transporter TctB family protein [Burkholderiales bacterium]
MSRRTQENIVAVIVLSIFIGVIVVSMDFGPRARMIPLPLAIFGIILTLVQLVWQNLRSTDELQMDMISVSKPALAPETEAAPVQPARDKSSNWKREAAAYGIVAVLLALVLLVGPIPAIFLFTAGYFLLSHQYSWKAGLIYTALFTASIYLLFGVALGMQPYHGLLAPLIDSFG